MCPRAATVATVLAAIGSEAAPDQPQFSAFTWKNDAPNDIPFKRSSLFTEVEFTGRYATYGGADTWYPSWGADGNLYTPWTDGAVNGVRAFSGCASEGCMSKTGFATVTGDHALNLTVQDVGTFDSSPSPYHGRYPCGSLYYNSTWFYGTYTLDNENHQPGSLSREPIETQLRFGRAGYCDNWCIQGPFAGFRWSRDKGNTWHEPRVHMKGWDDNIFGEQAPDNHTSKVKYGAPHVVDLGRELEHAPQGDDTPMMYVVGHGTHESESPSSWMQGSDVYIARVAPTVEAVEDRAQWEFYAGDGKWVAGDVQQARPLLSWGNRTGVTTMTYIPAVKRYIMCISTPTFSPFTEEEFDTYFLESEGITGPFSYITYMRMFGPESYFVNIPSKFVSPSVDPEDGSLSLFLSYSANFAFHSGANPPGSGYHWTLQEIKFRPGHNATQRQVFV
ncbi:unnamed protein product [Prorocentrum cordatum]|nr:unnamed protein product [Polarella glacialis]